MGMMGKLQEAKQQAEEARKRLDSVYVSGESGSGAVRVTASASKEIKDIEIADALLEDKEELIDMLVIALNNTLKKAKEVEERELKDAVKDHIPNIPGMGL